jgi:hypothetical protein
MMLLSVLVRVQDSRCMGLGSVSRDLSIPSGVRLMVVLLVVVWPVVFDMPIYDGFSDMYMFRMLHVLYIYPNLTNFQLFGFIYRPLGDPLVFFGASRLVN